MKSPDLIKEVATAHQVSPESVQEILEHFMKGVLVDLKSEKDLTLPHLGTFSLSPAEGKKAKDVSILFKMSESLAQELSQAKTPAP